MCMEYISVATFFFFCKISIRMVSYEGDRSRLLSKHNPRSEARAASWKIWKIEKSIRDHHGDIFLIIKSEDETMMMRLIQLIFLIFSMVFNEYHWKRPRRLRGLVENDRGVGLSMGSKSIDLHSVFQRFSTTSSPFPMIFNIWRLVFGPLGKCFRDSLQRPIWGVGVHL